MSLWLLLGCRTRGSCATFNATGPAHLPPGTLLAFRGSRPMPSKQVLSSPRVRRLKLSIEAIAGAK